MLKGLKVVFVAYLHNIDTFNTMSKGSKDYVMLKQGTNTFLLITNGIPMVCMSKHIEGVESQSNFQPL